MNAIVKICGKSRRRERGVATLAIGVLLLFLVTLVLLYGARVGVMEQRISANEYRQKEAMGAAEAGLNIGIEFLKTNREKVRDGTNADGWVTQGLWQQCDAASCPNLDQSGFDVVNETIYRLVTPDNAGDPAPVNTLAGTAFNDLENAADYQVNYYLCQVGTDANGVFDACASGAISDDTTEDYAVLVTATGHSADRVTEGDATFGGSSEAEVRQIVSTFASLPISTPAPIVASSNIGGNGTFDVVGNPDGGGPGVPLSIWTGDDFEGTGNFYSCDRDEYFYDGSSDIVGEDQIEICDSCACPQDATALSRQEGGQFIENLDIVDVDNNNSGGDIGYTLDGNFPDDLFEFVFGVPQDDYKQVKELATILSGGRNPCQNALDETSSGFYWVEGDCTLQHTLGSADAPLLIVVEGDVRINANTDIYGLVYAFSCTGACADVDGNDLIPESDFRGNGTVRMYGALMSDHQIDNLNGTMHIVYYSEILERVRLLDQLRSMGPVPGSWTDMVAVN